MAAGQSNGSRGSNGLRVLIAIVGSLVPLAPGIVSGCGSDDSAVAPHMDAAAAPLDATIPLVMVVTGGGGGPSADGSGSSSGSQNPFGDLPEASSGSSSGGGMPAPPDSGTGGDDAADGAEAAPPPAYCPSTYLPIPCGADAGDTCDLRFNTCCVTLSLQERCIPGANAKCNNNEASVHCSNACDCTGGQVCCGVANKVIGVVQSVCQTVTDGLCNPHPPTNTQASAQLCNVDNECQNGGQCLLQTCQFGAMFHLCGLQSGDPFLCTAN